MTGPGLGQVAVIPGSSSFVTWAVCKITGSHCGHMIIKVSDTECVSADADVNEVRVHPLTDFGNAVWSKFDMTTEQSLAAVSYAMAQVGKPYAYLDDGLIGLERIFRFRFPDWVRQRFQDDGQWQCAQLADASLAAAKVNVFKDGRMVGDVYPGSYEQLFVDRGWYTAEFFASFPLRPW
jgi:hypothetical protein